MCATLPDRLSRELPPLSTNGGEGNYDFTNLPRKFNIAIEGSREDSIHSEINDIAFIPAFQGGIEGSTLGFNVLVGGFFSAQRCDSAIPLNAWVPADETVVELCRAILTVFRDRGARGNRQKTRLMWLIDAMGLADFRAAVEAQMGQPLLPAAPEDAITEAGKSDHLGVHAQKQAGLNYVGLHVPVGHILAEDLFEFARLAEVYGNSEIRLTVEQNVIVPNIPDARLEAFLQEAPVQKFSIDPSPLVRTQVSCTGSRFCNFALIETKQRAHALAQELDALLQISQPVRMHWTGCPNSCGQPQVADIGFLGTKARKDGKSVEAVDIYMGGKVGKHAQLGERVMQGVPCEDLQQVVADLLKEKFGATAK
jgi:ferredoxin-nitrite reductase